MMESEGPAKHAAEVNSGVSVLELILDAEMTWAKKQRDHGRENHMYNLVWFVCLRYLTLEYYRD